jgi:hypothetical protein
MKKISILCSAILGIFLMGSTIAHSQSFASWKPESINFSEKAFRDHGTGTEASNTAVNVKSLDAFKKMFGDVPGVIWSNIDRNHDRAYFKSNGKAIRAGFNKKGKLIYTLSYYGEEHLPAMILLQVKRNYFGKSIFGITEVCVDGKTAYLIDLEDKTSWLKVKVLDDEMTEESVLLKR